MFAKKLGSIVGTFYTKFVDKLSKLWVLGSGIGKKTYSGFRTQGQKGFESRILNTESGSGSGSTHYSVYGLLNCFPVLRSL